MKTAGIAAAILASAAVSFSPALAQDRYGPGVSDSEIRIGHTGPYSGPTAAYGTIGTTLAAYFAMINEAGGINGRKITFISYDDGASPPRTVELARRLVERDEVLLIFQSLGTPHNLAIRDYLNENGVPQLFLASGADLFDDPENYPWTMRLQPSVRIEGRIFAQHIIDSVEEPRIAVLYQNDDTGRDYLEGLREGLGERGEIVAELPYELGDATVDSQVVSLRNTDANVFANFSSPKFAAQAIRRSAELDWHPLHVLASISNSVGGVLTPAGVENAEGIVTIFGQKDPSDPRWADDADLKAWTAFMERWYPQGDRNSSMTVYGYLLASALVKVLERAGDDLTRENVMRVAASLQDVELPMLLPGIRLNTSATDYAPMEQAQVFRFSGAGYEPVGPVIDASDY